MTNPDAVRLEPSKVAHLRSPQTLALTNGLKTEFKRELPAGRDATRVVDFKQLSDNEISVLRRALEARGIAVSPTASKSIALRVNPVSTITMVPGDVAVARVTLDAEFGDGTHVSVNSQATSGFGAERALHGALLRALEQLLLERMFVDYVNR